MTMSGPVESFAYVPPRELLIAQLQQLGQRRFGPLCVLDRPFPSLSLEVLGSPLLGETTALVARETQTFPAGGVRAVSTLLHLPVTVPSEASLRWSLLDDEPFPP